MPEQVDCILCDSKKKKILASKGGYSVVRCRGCSLEYISPRATAAEQGKMYESGYLANLQENKDLLIKTNSERLDFVKRFKKPGRLLDVGCGMGYFLDIASKQSWEVKGTELSQHTLNYCKNNYSFAVTRSDDNGMSFKDEKFDCITMWHILEHMGNPLKILIQAKEQLNDGGLLFLEIPNKNFLLGRLRPVKFRSYSEICEHLYYFDTSTLKWMLSLAGFSVQHIELKRIKHIRTGLKGRLFGFFSWLGWIIYKITSINTTDGIRVAARKKNNPLENFDSSRKIKILQIPGTSGWSGGEVYFKYIVEGLNKDIFDLHCICPEQGVLLDKLKGYGQRYEVVDMTGKFKISAVFKLARYIRKNDIDIVQSMGVRINFFVRLAKILVPRVKVISTIQVSLFDYPVHSIKLFIYLLADKLSCYLADSVVPVARSLATELIDKLGVSPRKIKVIYNSVDIDKFNPKKYSPDKIRSEFNIGSSPLLGLPARLSYQKGHTYFLDALSIVIKEFPDIKVLLVGDGPEKENIMAKIKKLSLEKACILTGMREDIPDIVSALDVYVLSSVSEGFPLATLEAMAMVKPVVATRINGVSEMLEDRKTGIVVEPRNPEQLAEGIITLLKDKSLAKKLAENACKVANAKFSKRKMVRDLEEHYLDILKKAKGPDC